MKNKQAVYGNAKFLKGVSTLDLMKKNVRIALLLLMMTALNGLVFGARGHSTLDKVDPTFNAQIQTDSFDTKQVTCITPQPDGKILVSGFFNSYNRQPVGSLIRLNADATLDTSFNNSVLVPGSYGTNIVFQPDGKIIVLGHLRLNGQSTLPKRIIRLDQNGTVDTTFDLNASAINSIYAMAIDANGRIVLAGNSSSGQIIRLNPNGTIDDSFRYASTNSVEQVVTQNNKVVFNEAGIIRRLNEDSSVDASFIPQSINPASFAIGKLIAQPNNKILVLHSKLQRLNENGDIDAGFAPSNLSSRKNMHLSVDGRITVVDGASSSPQIKRFLPNGIADASFSSFTAPNYGASAVLADGSIIVGDSVNGLSGSTIINNFLRVLPSGIRDTSFNVGGIGFQRIKPGSVRAITVQPDGKVLIGGTFDTVNSVPRFKIARLHADSTLDDSFQINTTPTGNYFTGIIAVYHTVVQSNGKIIVSGGFEYVLNGVTKSNVVRLNADGSIDATFNLSVSIKDVFAVNGNAAGTNKLALFGDGKLLVGTSRISASQDALPIKLIDGVRDTTFNPTVNPATELCIKDLAIQPDGKILIAGMSSTGGVNKGFIARLNADGSTDSTFQSNEYLSENIFAFALLSTGKILVVKNLQFQLSQGGSVFRLNADGSMDNSFSAGTGANNLINAILVLPSGRILLGGKFTNFNNQPRQHLALLSMGGSLESNTYNVDQEVLSLAADGDGRVLVGGSFTTINVDGGQNFTRSYLARLIDSSATSGRTRFDFDGDGKADLGIFTRTSGNWEIRNSLTNQASSRQFGQNGDRIASADYDGDGKDDIAVYRPNTGVWYLMQSTAGFTAYTWGAAEDKPFPADYDGDGKAEVAVWRPSNGVWYILRSNGSYASYRFGAATDIPVPADYDGDGKTDVAVWRPSNGTFYWMASATGNELKGVQFGTLGDIPAAADYNGDGKTDLVVFRSSTGVWYQYLSTAGGSYTFSAVQFGQNGDEPVAADYDGDGRTDIAVRRQGVWHMLKSNQGYSGMSFGSANAQAVAALPNPDVSIQPAAVVPNK